MKVDFSQPITYLDGTPLLPYDTLKKVVSFAIGQVLPGDENVPGDKKVALGYLGFTIYGSTEPVELQAADVVVLKERIAKLFAAPVIAQAWDMLEGKERKCNGSL